MRLLYVDEVNLLTDYLIDILLDAAATGILIVERDGISERHPASFRLRGTMNPEEGELRPQLLDRFALCCDLEDLGSPEERARAVQRRLSFEDDPVAFERAFTDAEKREAERLGAARARLASLELAEDLVDACSRHALAEGAEGLRADLVLCRAARAHAALAGKAGVGWDDVQAVADLALAHRRTKPPPGAPPPPSPEGTGRDPGARSASGDGGACSWQPRLDAGPPPQSALRASRSPSSSRSTARDRRLRTMASAEGRIKRAVPYCPELGIDLGAALLARALSGAPVIRSALRLGRPPVLTVLCVDASGSMGGGARVACAKGVLTGAMRRAYERRHRFALVAFRGAVACEVAGPTRRLRGMLARLDALAAGGGTSIAAGLEAAGKLLCSARRREPALRAELVLITDGRANQSLSGRPPLEEAFAEARALHGLSWLGTTVVDAELGHLRLGLAASLAEALGAALAPLRAMGSGESFR